MKKLHNLIHNLTQSEKRYIKLRLKANKSDSILIAHFDVLAKQRNYDFEELSSKENKTNKLLQTNLRLLYKVILKHLRSYNDERNSDRIMRGVLSDIETLMEKGMLNEAEKLNEKLIEKASYEENFEILKNAYQNLWNFYHLKGILSPEKTEEVRKLLFENQEKEIEITQLNALYRDAVTIYYQYFFHKRDESLKDKIKSLNNNTSSNALKTSKAKHIYFEVKAMEYMVYGDIVNHHNTRKSQLKHLFTSSVFETDYISKLLVLSNVFTYLKSSGATKELEAYLEFMDGYFRPLIMKNPDGVLLEKYYDIYFLNNCFLQTWDPSSERIDLLQDEFKLALSEAFKSNKLLVSRTYLGIAEVLILNGEFKKAIPLLIEFQDLVKDKKYSKHYIESELHFLALYYLMDKQDVFENNLKALKKKIRVHEIDLDEDQNNLLEVYEKYVAGKSIDEEHIESIKYHRSYKVYIRMFKSRNSITEIRKEFFKLTEETYSKDQDEFLKELYELSTIKHF